MPPRDRRHIIVRRQANAERYTPHLPKFDKVTLPTPPDPVAHATALTRALTLVQDTARQRRAAAPAVTVERPKPGLYIQFESVPSIPLKLESLENRLMGIELVAVVEQGDRQRATVFVPYGAVGYFLKRFQEYATQRTPKGARKNQDLVERLGGLRLATLRALWTDTSDTYPEPGRRIWWEVWLRHHDGNEASRLRVFAAAVQMEMNERQLRFEDRTIVLLFGTAEQLSSSIDVLDDLAEVRRAKETASFFTSMGSQDQGTWAEEMRHRVSMSRADAPAVCVLDTGVTRGHPLLDPLVTTPS